MWDRGGTRRETLPHLRLRFILQDDAIQHVARPIFTEMSELYEEGEEPEWRECARWIKFEEVVEEGGDRWSKPHVSTLSLQSLFELRSLFQSCALLLDLEVISLEDTADALVDHLVGSGNLPEDDREKVRRVLLYRHRHHHQRNNARIPIMQSLSGISRNISSCKPNLVCHAGLSSSQNFSNESIPTIEEAYSLEDLTGEQKTNVQLLKKLSPKTEASNILVGEMECLKDTVAAFIRLKHSRSLGDITEIPVPTRFMFVLLGPTGSISRFREIGRALATLCTEETFRGVVYKAKDRQHLLKAVDDFLNGVTVLPPGVWDPSIRIEPPATSQDSHKRKHHKHTDSKMVAQKIREEAGLTRTGRLFGGLINDFRRKLPWYFSDWRDAFATQCAASWLFLYFASLLPLITFGELLSEVTGKNMAAMECLVAGFVCGVVYGMFSGQPLILLSATAPVMALESIVFDFCRMMAWHHMSFRLWIGVWVAVILIILVAVDAAVFACYVTRFTEESFATIITFNFMYKAVEHVLMIRKRFPMRTKFGVQLDYNCICMTKNATLSPVIRNWANLTSGNCVLNNGTLLGNNCFTPKHAPDVFLMSVILFLGTFFIIIQLKEFKSSLFFPGRVKQIISEFAVIIAIVSMILLDFVVGSSTPKVELPTEFKPTLPNRGWLIPLFAGNPLWSVPLAVLPAMFCTILMFMDQQITSVVVNRKENKLRKGCGYHLDLCVLAVLTLTCSVMGLPWFAATTVLSMNHVNSLKVESRRTVPGEKPHLVGVREQRFTAVLIFVTVGLSVLITPVLRQVPMPVLYGVFLYSGVVGFKGLQLFDRITIMFMPTKYQPDFMFLRRMPIRRVHLFTAIQLACIVILWLIKSFRQTGILFPVALGLCIGVRKSLEFIFTSRELEILDNIIPESTKRKEDDQRQLEDDKDLNISLANGNVMKIPLTSVHVLEGVKETDLSELATQPGELSPREAAKQNRIKTLRAGGGRLGSKRNLFLEEEKLSLSSMEGVKEHEKTPYSSCV